MCYSCVRWLLGLYICNKKQSSIPNRMFILQQALVLWVEATWSFCCMMNRNKIPDWTEVTESQNSWQCLSLILNAKACSHCNHGNPAICHRVQWCSWLVLAHTLASGQEVGEQIGWRIQSESYLAVILGLGPRSDTDMQLTHPSFTPCLCSALVG